MAERQHLVPALEVNRSPGGTLRCPDSESRVLLEKTPGGRSLRVWNPPATPEVATPEVAGPSQPKKSRRCLQRRLTDRPEDIVRALEDSGSDGETDHDSDGGDYENFRSLRDATKDVRDALMSEDEESEVEEMYEREIERGYERERMEGEDAEVQSMGPEFLALDDFSWSDDFSTFSGQEETYTRTPGPSIAPEHPVDAFLAIWNEDIMKLIVKETNEYAWAKIASMTEEEGSIPEPLSSWTETTAEELYVYFGMLMVMSWCHRAVLSDNWTTGVGGMPDFRKIMSRNRFMLLTRLLHFVDNNIYDPSLSSYEKKISKIKPILDHCNERFSALYTPKKQLSLDESLLLWKGRLGFKQCIRTKAARFGIKTYELCEATSGYLLRCLIYAGKDSTMITEPIHGFDNCTAKVVLELMDGYLDVGHTLVMDNWYNQLSLTRFLKRRCTDVIGTMSSRRIHVPNEIKEANANRMARGEQIARHCDDISLVAWKDIKLVTAVSTFHGDEQVSASRAGVPINKPQSIVDYNKYMGGVDSKDQQLSGYLMERKRGRKWYMKVFKRLLNTSLLNAFIIFRQAPDCNLTHRQFREAVVEGLFNRFSTSTSNIRTVSTRPLAGLPRRLHKNVDHYVDRTPLKDPSLSRPGHVQQRCARCVAAGRRTMVMLKCSYCDVPLCPGRCWSEYHSLVRL